jgi:Tfp pilus assembly protein PilV
MHTFSQLRKTNLRRHRERGSMLIELLISMSILAIGLGGVLILLVSSTLTNSKAGKDTTSTMVAEHVLEQISAQPANSTANLTITDCTGNAWTINTAGANLGAGTGGSYGGNGASLTTTGIVDWTQNYSVLPVGYAMSYVSCGAGGRQITYDVRWDVITMSTYSRMIVVSARPANSASVGGLKYVVPVNLRTIGGM